MDAFKASLRSQFFSTTTCSLKYNVAEFTSNKLEQNPTVGFVVFLTGKLVFSQPDGFRLGEVAEIEAQMFSFVQKFNRRTELEFSTEPAFLQNPC